MWLDGDGNNEQDSPPMQYTTPFDAPVDEGLFDMEPEDAEFPRFVPRIENPLQAPVHPAERHVIDLFEKTFTFEDRQKLQSQMQDWPVQGYETTLLGRELLLGWKNARNEDERSYWKARMIMGEFLPQPQRGVNQPHPGTDIEELRDAMQTDDAMEF